MRSRLFFLLALCVFATQVYAAEKPKELNPIIKAEKPYGEGTLKRLIFYAYDAQLWTDATKWSYQSAFALTLKYQMSFSTQELADKSIEEMERLQPLSSKQKQNYLAILTKAFPNVQEGDRISALYIPQQGGTFYYNGKQTSSVKSPVFAQKFLNIWFSEKTSEPRLRKKLLEEMY